jgi:uncharacterized repeat protein (TIGR03803 family)
VIKQHWSLRACVIFLLWAATAVSLPAQTYTVLHSFNATSDGAFPDAGLLQGTNGDFYGATPSEGADGWGTLFRITAGGMLTSLYNFDNNADGGTPLGGLIQGTDGNLYGTTNGGGANGNGYGTVFKITPRGKLATLHSFCSLSGCLDGNGPAAGLIQATDGNFYGTTSGGGANNGGTIFRITPSGTLTTIYSFCAPYSGCPHGATPVGALVQASDGNFYGTTYLGGGRAGFVGSGTIFEITQSGTLTTLHIFCSERSCPDGENPVGALIQATDGRLYGTTESGGANNWGTIFRITPSGTLTTVHSFDYNTDGAYPEGGLVQATDGNLYGTTELGNPQDGGTIFKIGASSTLTTIHNFCSQSGCVDGGEPYAGLVQGTDGNFYGTTSLGGANYYYGTVFSLSVGLGPFVETRPSSRHVGGGVKILGTNLTGATSVTFNGTLQPAFTVVSASEITTTVPAGATTGTVQVVTPGGTLSSNVPFRVTQ